MNKISIIADSIHEGKRITSYILTVPQIIVKELLRHRMFSFSSSSMRAIPFNKMIADTRENMFVPLAFQKHHSGMQGNEYLSLKENEKAKQQWINAAQIALKEAGALYNLGVTKQLCSRIIEPYGYAKILVTATEWDNFFELRCPKYEGKVNTWKSWKDMLYIASSDSELAKDDYNTLKDSSLVEKLKYSTSGAEIHIQALAEAMWDAKNESTPKELKEGEWHIPFGDRIVGMPNYTEDGLDYTDNSDLTKVKIATARCARLSYMTFDGEIDYNKDIELHNMLLNSKHLSPFEHCARVPFNKMDEEGWTHTDSTGNLWSGNFKKWIQYRQLIKDV